MKILLLGFFISSALICQGQPKSYSFVFLHKRSTPQELPKEQVAKIMERHLANIERLAKEEKLIAAGPFDGGGGIFILNTTSQEEAKLWLSSDPGIQANRWDVEILPYTPRVGGVCIAKPPYEMVAYQFIRLVKRTTGGANADVTLKDHEAFLLALKENKNVVTEGSFEPSGNIIILKEDPSDNWFKSDPAIKEGLISLDRKKLWIAKGSFCEQ